MKANRTGKMTRKKIAKIAVVTVTMLLIPLLLFIFATWSAYAADGKPKYYKDLTFPPLPAIQLPKSDRVKLKNGIVVYLMPDRELPLVTGLALIRTGNRVEAGDKVGLANLVSTVMRTGGTKAHPGDLLDRILERKAANIVPIMSTDVAIASFGGLTEDFPIVLDLFAEVLQQPAFPEDRLTLAKAQSEGGIARRNDDPGTIANREFGKLIYGNTSPYARTEEYATLKKITRQDLVDFHQTWYRPENLTLGIVGDFDPAVVKTQLEQRFGSWTVKSPKLKAPQLATVTQQRQDGTYFVNQPQLNQSSILIGHLGGLEANPDDPALAVMGQVLSGFGGRLFNEIRSRQGLAYSVYAAWSPGPDYPGLFFGGGQTRSEATVPFIQSLKKEIARIRDTPISPQELKTAKDGALNSFVFNFQSPTLTLSQLMTNEYRGKPADYLFTYQKEMQKTTIADVQRVAKKYLQPSKLVTVVVGNEVEIKPALSTLGKVTPIDVTIPK
jgi:zinc protease